MPPKEVLTLDTIDQRARGARPQQQFILKMKKTVDGTPVEGRGVVMSPYEEHHGITLRFLEANPAALCQADRQFPFRDQDAFETNELTFAAVPGVNAGGSDLGSLVAEEAFDPFQPSTYCRMFPVKNGRVEDVAKMVFDGKMRSVHHIPEKRNCTHPRHFEKNCLLNIVKLGCEAMALKEKADVAESMVKKMMYAAAAQLVILDCADEGGNVEDLRRAIEEEQLGAGGFLTKEYNKALEGRKNAKR